MEMTIQNRAIESAVGAAGLGDIFEKVQAGSRISRQDGLRLFESRALVPIAAMANLVRERKNGGAAYFVRNMHLNPTNVCVEDCKFCGFYRPYREKESGWTWTLEECLRKVREGMSESLTEVHIVGGHNPDYPYDFYIDLLRGIREIAPSLHIKAYTCAEYEFFSRRFKKPVEEIFEDFKAAGLGSLPGGGAEVFSERVHREIYPKKLTADEWLDVAAQAHRAGLRSNATMLYGHIETWEERIDHLDRLRLAQDRTGGFMCFIPLAFHPENTEMADLPGPSGLDELLTIAVSRLMLDNFDHIKAYWIMISPRLAQQGLWCGADDIDGTIVEEKIVHMAGATTPVGMTMNELLRLIRETGRVPVQRDSTYGVVRRFEDPVAVP
jgi:aminodeoxyfutalosine synthase